MKTIEISGIIENNYTDNWRTIKLIQEDLYKIDLVSRFKEATESFLNMQVQVSYYLSDSPKTKEEMLEGFLRSIYGSVDVGFEANDYRYSSWTSGTDYDTNLKIGGHDLFSELLNEEGRFLLIILNWDRN